MISAVNDAVLSCARIAPSDRSGVRIMHHTFSVRVCSFRSHPGRVDIAQRDRRSPLVDGNEEQVTEMQTQRFP